MASHSNPYIEGTDLHLAFEAGQKSLTGPPRNVDDLIERLTEYNKDWRTRAGSAKEVAEAIAEIGRLRALVGSPTGERT